MKKEDLRKAWLAAAVISGAIISAIFVYALVVEAISRMMSFKPLLTGTAATAVRYAFYIAGAGAIFALKFIRPAMEAKGGTAPEMAQALVKQAGVSAALCEVPAFLGLMLFFLAGGYWDFYLLAVFSTVMEIAYFPKCPAWEEKMRGHGLTLE